MVATVFSAQAPWSGDPVDGKVLHAAGAAVTRQLEAIRDSAPAEGRKIASVEAAAAFAVAAGNARGSAPGWWDSLMTWVGGQLTDTIREAFAEYQKAPNILGELITRRSELQKALAAFRLPALARWSAEDARRQTLENQLAVQEGRQRDARLQAINDKAISLRGTPHADTLTKLKTTQPALARKVYRTGLWFMVGITGLTAGAWSVRNIDVRRFSEQNVPLLLPMLLGLTCVAVGTFFFLRTFIGRFWSFALSVVFFFSAGNFYNANGGFLRYTSNRFYVGLIMIAWLGFALLLRWKHSRSIVNQAEQDARSVPSDLAAGVKKACNDAESLGQAALGERWLMMHAVLALAVDPNQVQVDHVPGNTAKAA